MKKRIFLAALFLVFTLPCYVSASSNTGVEYFSYSLSTGNAVPGDIVKLCINANKTEITAAGFRIKVTYDQNLLQYIGTETSKLIKSGTMVTNDRDSPIYSVYVCNTDKSSAPKLYGNIICYVFQVKSSAAAGKTAVEAAADQLCDYAGNQLNADCSSTLSVNIKEPSSDEAYLTQLEPLSGRLNPVFSSEEHNYAMEVPYNVSYVEFQAAAGDGGSVKINRKTLYAAGKSTVIIATVTSADKHNKSRYIVTVKRKSKPQSAQSANLPKHSVPAMQADGDGQISSGGKTRHKTEKGTSSSAKNKKHKISSRSKKSSVSEIENEINENDSQDTYAGEEADTPSNSTEAVQTAAYTAPLRNIYITQNGMPAYMGGMMVTVICLMCGILLSLWLRPPNKK